MDCIFSKKCTYIYIYFHQIKTRTTSLKLPTNYLFKFVSEVCVFSLWWERKKFLLMVMPCTLVKFFWRLWGNAFLVYRSYKLTCARSDTELTNVVSYLSAFSVYSRTERVCLFSQQTSLFTLDKTSKTKNRKRDR